MITIHDCVAAGRHRLRDAKISSDEAELDARLLAEHVLGWTTERYFTHSNTMPPDGFEAAYAALIARRAEREPYAYIVGHQEFWGLAFEVTAAVLIPRPETELIVEAALEALPDAQGAASIADVGTGSGCLAIVLARERPAARVTAIYVSPEAIDVARRNAQRHGVDGRIEFVRTDLLDGIAPSFDVIVSNPPYVRDIDERGLQPEVQLEPAQALFGGRDGLDIIRRLLPAAAAHLRPGGTLAFEFGFGQDDAVVELISASEDLRMVAVRSDLVGIPRIAIAKRK